MTTAEQIIDTDIKRGLNRFEFAFATVRLTAPNNFYGNACCMHWASTFVVVIASVALNDRRLREWSSRLAAYGQETSISARS